MRHRLSHSLRGKLSEKFDWNHQSWRYAMWTLLRLKLWTIIFFSCTSWKICWSKDIRICQSKTSTLVMNLLSNNSSKFANFSSYHHQNLKRNTSSSLLNYLYAKKRVEYIIYSSPSYTQIKQPQATRVPPFSKMMAAISFFLSI